MKITFPVSKAGGKKSLIGLGAAPGDGQSRKGFVKPQAMGFEKKEKKRVLHSSLKALSLCVSSA